MRCMAPMRNVRGGSNGTSRLSWQRAGGALAPKIDGARCLLLEEEGPEEVEKRLNEILNAPVR
ncbi:MAG: hypothetical protein ACLTCB_06930 [Merdibacter sp.]